MKNIIQYGLIAAVIGGIFLYGQFNDGDTYAEDDIDLNAVLDVTVDALYSYNDSLAELDQNSLDPDVTFADFAESLSGRYNETAPALYEGPIGVEPRSDASLLAFHDANNNAQLEENEEALFLIEIDGEQARIIASSRSGAVNDHHFSGTGLLAGYLIGSMLNRQRMSGVSSSSLASKQPVSARDAAKSRAGSGSHSKGK